MKKYIFLYLFNFIKIDYNILFIIHIINLIYFNILKRLIMSEKNTDHLMINEYNKVFNKDYHTESNKNLFGSKIPDGWDILEIKDGSDILIIIENKRSLKQINDAKKQLEEYYNLLNEDIKSKYNIYLIAGLGNTIKSFKYYIYDSSFNKTNKTLEDIKKLLETKVIFDIGEIHRLNQYLYDNSINLPKSQKTLFIAAILICLKIDKDIIKDYDEKSNAYIIADKMISTIKNYYNDITFANMFNFIKKSIHNKHLYKLFQMLEFDLVKYGKDVLNQFYSEFCIWDKNNDAAMGVVLTPSDIVELMVKELNINKEDKVCDFCTGTGSFLIECGKYTNNLYGCENNDERYSLAKCNFILNDLDYTNLKYNSCFNEHYVSDSFDKIIINPPFSCGCIDEDNKHNLYGWKQYQKEQKFIMFAILVPKDMNPAALSSSVALRIPSGNSLLPQLMKITFTWSGFMMSSGA